ncbi:hypothetical protein V8J88_19765 [Massilia sp. W12]|uniref:hypothetical protein n=1 Tax=Massilia sp. W12 TaxID=3126507 RepID=UPI0030CF7A40
MEIDNYWIPTLLQTVRDGIRYKEGLLTSETLRDIEAHEEDLMLRGDLIAYLVEQYNKHQADFKFTPAQLLEGKE